MKKQIMSKRRFATGDFVEGEAQNMPRSRTAEDDQEAADKAAGLAASNKEKSTGFFERLRMGNIDDPSSEAYKRLGAGRGRAERIPVEDVTPTPKINNKSEGMDAFNKKLQASKDAEQPDRNKLYERGVPARDSGHSYVPTNLNLRESAAENMFNSENLGNKNESGKWDTAQPSDAGSSLGLSPYKAKKKLADKPALEKTTSSGSKYKSGGSVASSRADGIAQRGKTRGKMC